MFDGIDLNNNIALQACTQIEQICTPLHEFLGTTYFNYVKIFPDGQRITLTDRGDFIHTYYQHQKLYLTKNILNIEASPEKGYRFFIEFSDQPSYVIARNDFNIDNGIIMIHPLEQYSELFYLGTTANNYRIINKYLTNLDVLYRFIFYFKEVAGSLIQEAEQQKFLLPGSSPELSKKVYQEEVWKKQAFFKKTKCRRFYFGDQKNYLTRREAECIALLINKKSIKEIASALQISPRTAESHLENVKLKLGVTKKKEVIDQVFKYSLDDIIFYGL